MNQNQDTYGTVQSVGKAMTLLNILLDKKDAMTLKNLSDASGFPKSTVHAILSTLRDYRTLQQLEDGRYSLGIHLYELGCAAASSWDISSIAHPYLEKLSEETGASSFIAFMDKDCGLTFDHCSGSVGLQVVSELGARLPLHATCQGKILLSGLSDETIQYMLSKEPLAQYTPHTITDIDRLLDEIHKVRQQGYAVEDGEYRIGLRAVAAGIKDKRGRIKYALGSLGLFRKVSSDEFQETIRQTIHYADLISSESIN